MIGTNDGEWQVYNGTYQANLNRVVETSIEMGVIPVLSTIPWNRFRDPAPFNAVIITTARAYDIPLVDFYSVVDRLPNHGVGEDGVHLSIPPGGESGDFSSYNLQFGYTMRNLVTLQALDAVWRQAMY
jgi:lysophospholipase L1-like esterase